MVRDKCTECGATISKRWGKDYTGLCRGCSKRGKRNPQWKGGKHIYHDYEYVRISSIEDDGLKNLVKKSIENRSYGKRRSGMCYLHHIKMIEKLGRPLEKGEEVHHIDGNKVNNSLDNLILLDRKEHRKTRIALLEELRYLRDVVKTQSELIRNYEREAEMTSPAQKSE
jgi:hypothetical protein